MRKIRRCVHVCVLSGRLTRISPSSLLSVELSWCFCTYDHSSCEHALRVKSSFSMVDIESAAASAASWSLRAFSRRLLATTWKSCFACDRICCSSAAPLRACCAFRSDSILVHSAAVASWPASPESSAPDEEKPPSDASHMLTTRSGWRCDTVVRASSMTCRSDATRPERRSSRLA